MFYIYLSTNMKTEIEKEFASFYDSRTKPETLFQFMTADQAVEALDKWAAIFKLSNRNKLRFQSAILNAKIKAETVMNSLDKRK